MCDIDTRLYLLLQTVTDTGQIIHNKPDNNIVYLNIKIQINLSVGIITSYPYFNNQTNYITILLFFLSSS